jgi:hypothetical protein
MKPQALRTIVGASLAHQIAFNRTWYGRSEASLGILGTGDRAPRRRGAQ